MTDAIEPLLIDLVSWIAKGPREYTEVMEAWRTSCPRLPVWEEANARGLVTRELAGGVAMVRVTEVGRAFAERC
jgi:D-3-phosphoglycerate dehydrogenase